MKPNEHRTVNGSRGYHLVLSDREVKTDITEMSYLVRIMDHPVALENWLNPPSYEEDEVLERISVITGYTSSAPPIRTMAMWMSFRQAIFNFYCEYVAREFAPFV